MESSLLDCFWTSFVVGCLLDKSCELLLGEPTVFFRLASPGLVAEGLLVVAVASRLLVGQNLAILGVMGEIGPIFGTEERRFLLVARGRVALLLGILVVGLGFLERFFDTFNSFHEVDDLENWKRDCSMGLNPCRSISFCHNLGVPNKMMSVSLSFPHFWRVPNGGRFGSSSLFIRIRFC
jgi:hypothetical protein